MVYTERMIVSITQFSKMTGKSRVAIYKAIEGERLFKTDDGKIDTDDPASMTFAASNSHNRGGQRTKLSQSGKEPADKKNEPSPRSQPQSRTGSHRGLDRSELENEKIRQQVIKLELENNIKTGAYVPRDMVQEKVLNPIDEFFIKMISDLPRSMLMSVKESLGAGMTDGEIERGLKSLLESHIKRAKADLRKGLR